MGEEPATEKRYSIGELSALSGYSRRTIHYYVQQGLLMPPYGAGLGAFYTPAHLTRLQVVRRRRAAGQRLERIRAEIQQGSGEDGEVSDLQERSAGIERVPDPAQIPFTQNTTYQSFPLRGGMVLLVPLPLAERHQGLLKALLDQASSNLSPQ